MSDYAQNFCTHCDWGPGSEGLLWLHELAIHLTKGTYHPPLIIEEQP